MPSTSTLHIRERELLSFPGSVPSTREEKGSLDNLEILVQSCKPFEECLEQIDVRLDIMRTTSFPARVHRQDRHAHIHSPNADLAQHGSDGRSARHVVTRRKLLYVSSFSFYKLSDKEAAPRISSVPEKQKGPVQNIVSGSQWDISKSWGLYTSAWRWS